MQSEVVGDFTGEKIGAEQNRTEQLRKLGKISTLCNYPDKFNQYWSPNAAHRPWPRPPQGGVGSV